MCELRCIKTVRALMERKDCAKIINSVKLANAKDLKDRKVRLNVIGKLISIVCWGNYFPEGTTIFDKVQWIRSLNLFDENSPICIALSPEEIYDLCGACTELAPYLIIPVFQKIIPRTLEFDKKLDVFIRLLSYINVRVISLFSNTLLNTVNISPPSANTYHDIVAPEYLDRAKDIINTKLNPRSVVRYIILPKNQEIERVREQQDSDWVWYKNFNESVKTMVSDTLVLGTKEDNVRLLQAIDGYCRCHGYDEDYKPDVVDTPDTFWDGLEMKILPINHHDMYTGFYGIVQDYGNEKLPIQDLSETLRETLHSVTRVSKEDADFSAIRTCGSSMCEERMDDIEQSSVMRIKNIYPVYQDRLNFYHGLYDISPPEDIFALPDTVDIQANYVLSLISTAVKMGTLDVHDVENIIIDTWHHSITNNSLIKMGYYRVLTNLIEGGADAPEMFRLYTLSLDRTHMGYSKPIFSQEAVNNLFEVGALSEEQYELYKTLVQFAS